MGVNELVNFKYSSDMTFRSILKDELAVVYYESLRLDLLRHMLGFYSKILNVALLTVVSGNVHSM